MLRVPLCLVVQPAHEDVDDIPVCGLADFDKESAWPDDPLHAERCGQRSIAKMLRQVRPLADSHAAAFDRRFNYLVVVRETKPAGALGAAQFDGIELLLPVVPRSAVNRRLEVEQDVLRQIGSRSQRARRIIGQRRSTHRELLVVKELVA